MDKSAKLSATLKNTSPSNSSKQSWRKFCKRPRVTDKLPAGMLRLNSRLWTSSLCRPVLRLRWPVLRLRWPVHRLCRLINRLWPCPRIYSLQSCSILITRTKAESLRFALRKCYSWRINLSDNQDYSTNSPRPFFEKIEVPKIKKYHIYGGDTQTYLPWVMLLIFSTFQQRQRQRRPQ